MGTLNAISFIKKKNKSIFYIKLHKEIETNLYSI